MFRCFCIRRKKKSQNEVAVGAEKIPSPQKSVDVEELPKRHPVVPDTPATSATRVSPPGEAPKKKTSWWRKLFRRKTPKKIKDQTPVTDGVAEEGTKESEVGGAEVKEASPTPVPQVPPVTELQIQQDDAATSGDTIRGSEVGEADSKEAPSTPECPVSAEIKLQEEGAEEEDVSGRTTILSSSAKEECDDTINSNCKSEDGDTDAEEASPIPDPPVRPTTQAQNQPEDRSASNEESEDVKSDAKEASTSPDLPVTPTTGPQNQPEDQSASIEEAEGDESDVRETSPTPDPPVTPTTEPKNQPDDRSTSTEESEDTCTQQTKNSEKTDSNADDEATPPVPTGHGGSQQVQSDDLVSERRNFFLSARRETLSREELRCLGLPNLWQTCYMNSTLQGLLTLTPFIQEVHNQQKVWLSHPNSQLIRGLTEVQVCHFIDDNAQKMQVLAEFKQTVAEYNSEFKDDSQKDAHEFLSCVLDGLRGLAYDMHSTAMEMGTRYTCPVDAHIAFQMIRTRTCLGCEMISMKEEDYMNLSLNLVPGGSVSSFLENYQKDSQLEYLCECGSQTSSQQYSFLTLPNVLILQLQRFRFTKSFELKKLNSRVIISQELLVNPEYGSNKNTRYSLVSIVSHLGSSAHSGHYICEGAHRQENTSALTDRWLEYNDEDVSETTCRSVCRRRQQTAYLLFYEKQE